MDVQSSRAKAPMDLLATRRAAEKTVVKKTQRTTVATISGPSVPDGFWKFGVTPSGGGARDVKVLAIANASAGYRRKGKDI